ncbi:MAG: flagellar assembly peptidoglycan hydrolase FlgJ [Zoogloeaceae bacterium]|jgi:flagellar protein FlgJ|nr:flagellar assembly peptidoglycan hydrolase FlgJ [Zoogloeaceae bacterium]
MTLKPYVDNTLAGDVKSAQSLRSQMKNNPGAGVKAAAQEFEAMFLQMVMKSMRATMGEDTFMDSDSTRFFTGMLDEQMAKDISRAGGLGLAEILEKQLTQRLGLSEGDATEETTEETTEALDPPNFTLTTARNIPPAITSMSAWRAALEKSESVAGVTATSESGTFATAREFVSALWPHAVEASRDTGIPPQFLIAHAALESGWGKRNILNADGSSSYNLFGIKAGGNWSGKSAEVTTTEYVDGHAQREQASFRAYDSYADSFRDYANLLRDNPRYGSVIGSQNGTEFARRLQQAGYATDPRYAEKLAAIIEGPTLREALIG